MNAKTPGYYMLDMDVPEHCIVRLQGRVTDTEASDTQKFFNYLSSEAIFSFNRDGKYCDYAHLVKGQFGNGRIGENTNIPDYCIEDYNLRADERLYAPIGVEINKKPLDASPNAR